MCITTSSAYMDSVISFVVCNHLMSSCLTASASALSTTLKRSRDGGQPCPDCNGIDSSFSVFGMIVFVGFSYTP